MRLMDLLKQAMAISFFSHAVFAQQSGIADIPSDTHTASPRESIAFYYNSIDSVRELMNYDRVVVTPSLISKRQIKTLHSAQTSVFAYLSIGEFNGQALPVELSNASPATNKAWQSHVMDLSHPAWQSQLQNLAKEYLNKGFDGLFLDTLDSYLLFAKDQTSQTQQQKALAHIINNFYTLTPKPKLILNRGFEIVSQLQQPPYALAAESLYHSYHPVDKSYTEVKPSDREWLNGKLASVKALGIETIVIDYLPTSDRKKQKTAARRLIKEGYTPYVSDGMLYEFGISTIEPIAKRVLGLYDSNHGNLTSSHCHRLISMPVEYQGYVPDCQDINKIDFSTIDMSKYAALIIWLETSSYHRQFALQKWLKKVIYTRPILFLNSLPNDPELLAKLGINKGEKLKGRIRISKGHSWLNKSYPVLFSQFEQYTQWKTDNRIINTKINATDGENNTSALLFSAKWGGAILAPLPVANLANHKESWLVDPFLLIKETLNLSLIPAADVTTESGRRVLTSHVDGDGFVSKGWFPDKPFTSKVLLENIFKPYTIPQTVSVIEGEIGKRGINPKQSSYLETIAREIFKLPHIEIASHTFSHPFFWDYTKTISEKEYGDHLAIPGYTIDYNEEIIGSTNYINNRLAPKGKKVKLILWSGKADPSEDILNIAEKAELLNVNGGNTFVVDGNNDLTHVSPTISWYPSAVQVYAPILNENLYTNLWSEHHDGYERTIETFKLLGSPRRLKSISIYYHMYSGAYPASLKSLKNVYDWALNQKATPLYLSEYSSRAKQLYETGIAKTLDGNWLITSSGVRSIRLPKALGFPVINKSNIAGWEYGPDGKYLTLVSPRTRLVLSPKSSNQVRLANANAPLTTWVKNGKTIKWGFNSYVPFKLEIANGAHCKVNSNNPLIASFTTKNRLVLQSEHAGQFEGQLVCNK